jgi:hypothetical protein
MRQRRADPQTSRWTDQCTPAGACAATRSERRRRRWRRGHDRCGAGRRSGRGDEQNGRQSHQRYPGSGTGQRGPNGPLIGPAARAGCAGRQREKRKKAADLGDIGHLTQGLQERQLPARGRRRPGASEAQGTQHQATSPQATATRAQGGREARGTGRAGDAARAGEQAAAEAQNGNGDRPRDPPPTWTSSPGPYDRPKTGSGNWVARARPISRSPRLDQHTLHVAGHLLLTTCSAPG